MVQDLKSMSMWAKGAMTLFAAFAIYGAVSLGIMVADRQPPIFYIKASALSVSVPQGGTIEVEFEVERSRICSSTVKRWLVDSAGTRHSITNFTVGSNLKKGREVYQRSITIPANAAVGTAYYEVKLEFACNVIQRLGWTVKVNAPHIKFEITPSTSLVPFQPPVFESMD
ncbi:hypothetical protein [Phyllobacterium sp. YR531]|uniref:hypothetical protein n=1 Tax=Phyllobacterium sp. YR531 TaxID=1144343 RepID=UPI00026FB23D|nr:hypothetical protein [Phyllobacterium sp. YR531]EJN04215.1 hypothetical protein PMI41_01854 [Phyllobacterium sp. YR531]